LKKTLALILTLAAAISLSGCAPTNPADAIFAGVKQTCKDFVTGKNADSIQVDGAKGQVPTVKFATPLTSKIVETKVISEGNGPKITGDQLAQFDFVGVNAGTGKVFQATKFDGSDRVSQYLRSGGNPDFCGALAGVREGSRVAVLFPAALAHQNKGVSDLGIGKDQGIVFVFDITKVYLPYAVGDGQAAQSGMPTVVRATTGEPGVTVPKTAAPKDEKVSVLIKGRGAEVKADDSITVHYSGFLWSDGSQFDSSWTTGQPATFQLTKGQLIDGFIEALVGQTVGSQILAVIPPDKGYGNQVAGAIPANSTLVFVMDILGTESTK
jgi:peptidylprolyl isomerase